MFHELPAFVEMKIVSSDVAAASCWPSADEVTDRQFVHGTVVSVQVTPKSVEMNGTGVLSKPAAINRFPSAELATEHQLPMGALVCVQVVPEFVET
jgi:hypothetical protein